MGNGGSGLLGPLGPVRLVPIAKPWLVLKMIGLLAFWSLLITLARSYLHLPDFYAGAILVLGAVFIYLGYFLPRTEIKIKNR